MKSQFTRFTPEAMTALGNDITASFRACSASFQSCADFTENMRASTAAMMEKFQEERRERADGDADARKVFASELRSDVRALLDRCELTRETLASDIHAASEAFRKARPRHGVAQPRKAPPSRKPAAPAARAGRTRKH
jgi:hypothetical protein